MGAILYAVLMAGFLVCVNSPTIENRRNKTFVAFR